MPIIISGFDKAAAVKPYFLINQIPFRNICLKCCFMSGDRILVTMVHNSQEKPTKT